MSTRRPTFPASLSAPPKGRSVTVATPMATPVKTPRTVAAAPVGLGLDSQAVRERMVKRLVDQGLSSKRVADALRQVERHRFVDSALVNQAYEDTSLPIGLGQTISKPNVVGRMLDLLVQAQVFKDQNSSVARLSGRVFEVGTGCGYQAAVLSHLFAEVYSMERLKGLHEKARDNLRAFRLPNVHLLLGDGMLGFARGAPYAAIIAAAGGDDIPSAWTDQLMVGGRLVAPCTQKNGQQALVVVDKTEEGLQQTTLEAVHFVPLKSGLA
mgnify:CR=1 FL=1